MAVKNSIAIIGASGRMGSALASSLAKGPYRLLLFSSDHEKVNRLAEDIRRENEAAEIEIIGCSFHASWEADIIIPAVPFAAEKEVAEKIREVATQKIVVSISNPFNASFDGLVTKADTSAAEELQRLLPNSKVVKAFNTALAGGFAQPVIDGRQADVFIAGDNREALAAVEQLVRVAGFNPLVAGPLSASRTLENMTVLLLRLNQAYGYNGLAGWKILHQ